MEGGIRRRKEEREGWRGEGRRKSEWVDGWVDGWIGGCIDG